MKRLNVRSMVQIAILGAVANILLLLRFPLPFMPPFMDFDLSGIPEIIGTFIMGPVAGIMIVIIKILVKLLMTGTTSMFTGELQNLILSCAYIIPAGIIYQKAKTKKAALIGMIAGTLICAVTAVFSNMYIIIPFYTRIYGLSMEQIIAMTQAVNKFVDSEWKFVALGVIPFNLIKGGITTVLIYAAYPIMMRIMKQKSRHAA